MRRYLPYLLIAAALFTAFYRLGDRDVLKWDESRYGQNAYWMIEKGDYVNYFYDGEPDPWVSKPPLAIWGIVAGYKIFGMNPFGLRFQAALSALLTLFVLYRLVRKFANTDFAYLAVFITLTTKGVFGVHSGRTGDTDAMLLLMLMSFSYFFLEWVETPKRRSPWMCALFFGLAFWTKGTGALYIGPSSILYAALRGRLGAMAIQPVSWFAAGAAALFPFGWYVVIRTFGQEFVGSPYLGKNAFLSMLLFDTVARVTENVEGHGNGYDWFFMFRALDVRFSVWIYLLWGALLFAAYLLVAKRLTWSTIRQNQVWPLTLYSLCICSTIGLALTFTKSSLNWYVAPMIPYCAILLVALAFFHLKEFTPAKARFRLFCVIGIIAFSYNSYRFLTSRKDPIIAQIKVAEPVLRGAKSVLFDGHTNQAYRLYLHWYSRNARLKRDADDVSGFQGMTPNIMLKLRPDGSHDVLVKGQIAASN